MDDLPIIDIGPLVAGWQAGPDQPPSAEELEVARHLDVACREVGFFVIVGHEIAPELLQSLDGAARRFFALPEADKAHIAMAHGGAAWRGWFPECGELTSGRPDHKEGLYFGAELPADDPRVQAGTPLHGPNLFPNEPPELRETVLTWIQQVTALGHVLARGIGLGLGLAPDWFHQHLTADPTVLFRIFRYPARPTDDTGWGVAEHTDYGLLTLLAHDGTPGLQVRTNTGWLDVPTVSDSFVINLGDMLERMTSGRYVSTAHRVRHGAGDGARDRLSFPFFFDPGWDAEILPAPLPDGPAAAADRARAARWDDSSVHEWSGTYGDYLLSKVAKVFPDLLDEVLPTPPSIQG